MSILQKYSDRFNKDQFVKLNEEMSFDDYLTKVKQNPNLARTAYQYLYDMILSKGTSSVQRFKKKYVHYNFFDDVEGPIFGLDETLHQLVQFFKGAAGGYGPERRVLLLHGPVGSSKSTILKCIKKGLEKEIKVFTIKALGKKCPICWKINQDGCKRPNCLQK